MPEKFRPHPENPKQNRPEEGAGPLGLPPPPNPEPEPGAGPIGLPPPNSEQIPQGEGSNIPERQPRQTLSQKPSRPEPESQAYPAPTPLNDFQSRQEQPRRDTISGGEVAKPLRELGDSGKEEKMPRLTTSNVEQFLQNLEKQFSKSHEVTAQEQESKEIEESIDNLKKLRTMSQRIDHATDINLEHLKKLWQHDPEFMRPILTGLVKRPARLEKKEKFLYRITDGDMNPANQPDYSLLIDKVALWHKTSPADYKDFLKKTSPMDRERIDEAWNDLFISMVGIIHGDTSELAGLQNALVCAHDHIRAFYEAGIEVPKAVTQVHRRLEKRRAYLNPDSTTGRHR
jgi:hypothetical protein